MKEINVRPAPGSFMKQLEGIEEPTVDDYRIANDPIKSSYVASYEDTEGAKHVIFSDEDEDKANVDISGILFKIIFFQ